MKAIKKLTAVLLLIACAISFCSCTFLDFLFYTATPEEMPKRSFDDFGPSLSRVGLGSNMIPEGFIDQFAYSEGYFYYYGPVTLLPDSRESLFMFFQYDDATYQLAKEYVIDTMPLSDSAVEEYNNYHFFDVLGDHRYLNRYPSCFIRFCYNDTNNTLIFLALEAFGQYRESTSELADDWSAFLDEFYGQWYDFSQ